MLAGRYNSGADEVPLISLMAAFGAIVGACYAINQMVDSKGDRLNSKLFLIAEEYISRASAAAVSTLLILAGVVWLFYLGFIPGLLGLLSFVIAGILYNFPPFLWKDRPVASLIVSFSGAEIAFLLGCYPLISLTLIWNSIPYLTAVAAVAALTAAPDVTGDEASGKNSFVLKYGLGRTTLMAAILCVISALLGWWNRDPVIFWPALLSLPLFIHTAYKTDRKSTITAIKFPIVFLSLAVGFRFPGYLVLIIAYFIFSRWYYRRRFNLDYPSFKPE